MRDVISASSPRVREPRPSNGPVTAVRATLPSLELGEVAPGLILLVDDEQLGARVTVETLEALGHEVVFAGDWAEAMRCFLAEPIDLVLMDAVMPIVDGFKLTRVLRRQARSYVPILFLTATTDEVARQRAIEAGADDILAKPLDPVELRLRLTAMLRLRRLTAALERRTQDLSRLARVDELTGLLNRRVLDEDLRSEVERARRYGLPFSLLLIDVDHFKRVNDTYGHQIGDELLSALGRLLRESLRSTDRAYRYGGEELVILVPQTPAQDAVALAERLRRRFHARSEALSEAGTQSLSIGVATLADLPPDVGPGALLEAADAALYVAKRGGRNRIAVGGGAATLPPPPRGPGKRVARYPAEGAQ